MKMVEAFLSDWKIIFAADGDQYWDDYFIVGLKFRTSLEKDGRTYKVALKGGELSDFINEVSGGTATGDIQSQLRSCRKKPVLLVISQEGSISFVKEIIAL